MSFRNCSSSQSSTGSKSSTENQEQLGLWLSLSPPRNFHCSSHSTRNFFSTMEDDYVSGYYQNANPNALTPPTNNNPNQVDTVLRLGLGPIDKVTPFYEVMPIMMKGSEICCFDDSHFGSGINYTYANQICFCPYPNAFAEIAQVVPLNYGAYAGEFGYVNGGFSEAYSGAENPTELALFPDS